ncbi:MAG: NADH-quinone oxidoreductase subunit D [Acidobacteria bacterium]|nr:NADH-quinone oxidoreductase subunit D [Acidobacteriota bacterium]
MASSPGGTETRSMRLNIGPSHPAMHGVIRLVTELEGEKVLRVEAEIGYLHRAFEKKCEDSTWSQAIPYTDRLNYVSPLINNFGYCAAVEKLMGIEVPERAGYIRVLMSEISRITDHLTCIGATAMELGAMTAFLYLMKAREYLYDIVERVTGARLTVSYGRIGGVKADLPEGLAEDLPGTLDAVAREIGEVDRLLTRNRIFVDRMRDVGALSRQDALGYSITGPVGRASGIDYDVRRDFPYFVYDRVDFEVPLGERGDTYDRYLVRMEEMRQSMRIIRQCLDRLPGGPVRAGEKEKVVESFELVDRAKRGRTAGLVGIECTLPPTLGGAERAVYDRVMAREKRTALPVKADTYANIEGLMNHFMLVMDGHGVRPPAGDAYFAVEGANGELGFFVVSDGTDRPCRVRVRPPCFFAMAGLHKMLEGGLVADIVATFGSINMIAGELDR